MPTVVTDLIERFGDPQIYPGVDMKMVWNAGKSNLTLLFHYDMLDGWECTEWYLSDRSKVPPEWMARFYFAAREIEHMSQTPTQLLP